jgi:hypothetical protein
VLFYSLFFCIPYFAFDFTASNTTQLTELPHRSVITVFGKIGRRIAEECERQSPFNSGEVEVDESYFGPHRVRGKRVRIQVNDLATNKLCALPRMFFQDLKILWLSLR